MTDISDGPRPHWVAGQTPADEEFTFTMTFNGEWLDAFETGMQVLEDRLLAPIPLPLHELHDMVDQAVETAHGEKVIRLVLDYELPEGVNEDDEDADLLMIETAKTRDQDRYRGGQSVIDFRDSLGAFYEQEKARRVADAKAIAQLDQDLTDAQVGWDLSLMEIDDDLTMSGEKGRAAWERLDRLAGTRCLAQTTVDERAIHCEKRRGHDGEHTGYGDHNWADDATTSHVSVFSPKTPEPSARLKADFDWLRSRMGGRPEYADEQIPKWPIQAWEAWSAAMHAPAAENPSLPAWMRELTEGLDWDRDFSNAFPTLGGHYTSPVDWFAAHDGHNDFTLEVAEAVDPDYPAPTFAALRAAYERAKQLGLTPLLYIEFAPVEPWETPHVRGDVSAFYAVAVDEASAANLDELAPLLGFKAEGETVMGINASEFLEAAGSGGQGVAFRAWEWMMTDLQPLDGTGRDTQEGR